MLTLATFLARAKTLPRLIAFLTKITRNQTD